MIVSHCKAARLVEAGRSECFTISKRGKRISDALLELIEEAFDEVALAVERVIARPGDLAIGRRRDDGSNSPLGEDLDEALGIVAFVANQSLWIGVVDQRFGASKIMGLARREHQLDGIAQGIDEGVNFGGQSATRSADRLRTVFFRAPAEC